MNPYNYQQPSQPVTQQNPHQHYQPQHQHYVDPNQQQQYSQQQYQQVPQGQAPTQQAAPVAYQPQPQPQPSYHHQPGQMVPNHHQQPQQQQHQQQDAGAPAAALQADANGLRWTWSSYPSLTKTKATSLASQYVPTAAITSAITGTGTDAHHIPVSDEMVIPLAAMYCPLGRGPVSGAADGAGAVTIRRTAAAPVACGACGAYLSKHATVDLQGRFWICPCCLGRAALPHDFTAAHAALAAETVEYHCGVPAATQGTRQVHIFVVDTALPVEELEALKRQLAWALTQLPAEALVGFVSFGRGVTVWDLGCEDVNRCYTLRGNRDFSAGNTLLSSAGSAISGALGTASPTSPNSRIDLSTSDAYIRSMLGITRDAPVTGRFLVPLSDCEFALTSIIDELSIDPFPVPTGLRPERATGTAVDAAATIIEALGEACCGKVLLFTGGPSTRGPGAIVSNRKEKMMRSHRDFQDGDVPLYQPAVAFYKGIEARLSAVGASVDCFVASFDQVGIMELRRCVNCTGGVFVCGDTFDHEMFSESLQRYYTARDFNGTIAAAEAAAEVEGSAHHSGDGEWFPAAHCGFAVAIDVFTSRDTLVSGAIGPCRAQLAAPPKQGPSTAAALAGPRPTAHPLPPIPEAARNISPIVVGEGNTQRWLASTVDTDTHILFVLDTATVDPPSNAASPTTPAPPQRAGHRFVQFVTHFTTPGGERRVRVCSVRHHRSPSADPGYFVAHSALDQTCAATVVARMAVVQLEDATPHIWESTKRWVDRLLVAFVRRFGTYQMGRPDSLRLSPSMSLFPSFMYNLRRSEYFMVMNISPDETVFKRHWLMRESCDQGVLMIQPTLHSYTFQCPQATPVPLDSNSILPDNILVIDCFFNLHIVWGQTVAEWQRQGYHENPDYAHFKDLLDAPERDCAAVLSGRFPYPRFSRTDISGGESRHLKTRLNPSTTHTSANSASAAAGSVINTDDASISAFMASLKEAVVRPADSSSTGGGNKKAILS